MFTIKLYSGDGFRQLIREAENFTILRGPSQAADNAAEITLHQKNRAEDCRFDIKDENGEPKPADGFYPPRFAKAIIENSAGRTTEIISLYPFSTSPK